MDGINTRSHFEDNGLIVLIGKILDLHSGVPGSNPGRSTMMGCSQVVKAMDFDSMIEGSNPSTLTMRV